MRALIFALPILCASVLNSEAQVASSTCEKISGSMTRAGEASDSYLSGLKEANLKPLLDMSKGDMREAATRAQNARDVLIPAMQAYVEALQDLAYQMKLCARRGTP